MLLKKDIYQSLFSDISKDYNDYEKRVGYSIVVNYHNEEDEDYNYLMPEKEIIIKRECFSIFYWPDSYENYEPKTFALHGVEIFQKTDEVILGEYIGENVEILIQKYKNKIESIIDNGSEIKYWYVNGKNPTSTKNIYLILTVKNKIIEKIFYGYADKDDGYEY